MNAETLFWLAAATVAYTFVGYPAALWVAARLRTRRVRRALITPSVAVIVVVQDEAARIRAKLESILAQRYPADRMRVIVASDGAGPEVEAIVRGLDDPRIEWIPGSTRRGKVACLMDAATRREEEVLVLTDARQPLHPDAVASLAANFADPRVGAVSGECMLVLDEHGPLGAGAADFWRYEKAIRRMESAIDSMVGVDDALYAIRRSALRPIPTDTVRDDVLIPMNVVRQGLRVVFDASAIAYACPVDEPAGDRLRAIRALAGDCRLIASQPWLLDPRRDRLALQFASHRLVRLVAPIALLTMLATSLALAPHEPFYAGAFAVQSAFYLLPAIGLIGGRAAGLRPVRIATAFLALNWVMLLGLVEWVSHREARA
jgi:biofilm PGA synthesis N-glycosyltransferase PgaC